MRGIRWADEGRFQHSRSRDRRGASGSGFTLIELTVAVSIMAVLGAIAQSSFQSYAMRARRGEARYGLTSIHRAQMAHYGEFLAYGDSFDEIGMPLDRATLVDSQTIQSQTYTFSVRVLPLDGHPQGNFQAVATGDLDPGDGIFDILMIENQLTVLQ